MEQRELFELISRFEASTLSALELNQGDAVSYTHLDVYKRQEPACSYDRGMHAELRSAELTRGRL